MKVRTSIGTANRIGLAKGRNKVEPTTAYLLLESGCAGKCTFCPQSTGDSEMVSRVYWPEHDLDRVIEGILNTDFDRVCLQTSIYDDLEKDLARVLKVLDGRKPISVSISPLSHVDPYKLLHAGVDHLGVPLDGATKDIVKCAKGYEDTDWEWFFEYIFEAMEVFGKDRVTTHIIVGLGETDRDLALAFRSFNSIGVNVALFALTPPPGSSMEPPTIDAYRRAQLMAHLLIDKDLPLEILKFRPEGSLKAVDIERSELDDFIKDGTLIQTRGCPGCNRPFYNESPAGPWFNFPRTLTKDEAIKESSRILDGLKTF